MAGPLIPIIVGTAGRYAAKKLGQKLAQQSMSTRIFGLNRETDDRNKFERFKDKTQEIINTKPHIRPSSAIETPHVNKVKTKKGGVVKK